jgi:MFS family permease
MGRMPYVFYGWFVVGLSVVTMMLIYGIRHSFSVFFPPILDEFGWPRGSTAAMLSLNILVYGFLAPLAGSLADHWKPRRIMPLGITVLALATAGCAFAQKLWHFYLLFGILMPLGSAFSGWPLLSPTLVNWFTKRRALAIGVGQMGGGLSFAYGMFAEFAISHFGWRSAYFVLAGTLLAVLFPVYLLFYYRPEDKGLRAYGTVDPSGAQGPKPEAGALKRLSSGDWSLSRALGTYQLWLIVVSYFLYWGVGDYLVLAHQVKFAEDAGYSSMFSASVFALFGIFMMLGQISASISDWLGREKTITLATILSVGALVALVSVRDTSQPWLLVVFATSFGYGNGLYTPTIFAGTADLFHGRHFGAISGLLLTGMGVGGAIGPWLGGTIYDLSGSYRIAFGLCMAVFALACITVWIAAPRNADALRSRMIKEGQPFDCKTSMPRL